MRVSADAQAIADALLEVAKAIREQADSSEHVAIALQRLGTANAATPMGAIEVLAMEIKSAGSDIAAALERRDE